MTEAFDAEICFGHFKTFLKLGGMYVSHETKPKWRWVQCLYALSVSSLLLGFLSAFSLIFTEEKGLTGSFTLSLTYWVCYAWSVYQVPATAISFSKYIEAFVKELSSFYIIYGSAVNLKKTGVIIKITFSTAVVFLFICQCLFTTALQPSSTTWGRRSYYPSYKMNGVSYFICISLTSLFHAYRNFGLFAPFLFFIALARIISKEFARVNQLVKQMVESKNVNEKCESLRKRHVLLCGVLKTGNKIVTHTMFSCFTTQIPILCFVLFGLLRGTLDLEGTMSSVALTGNGILVLFLMLFIGAYMSAMAHGCMDDLLRCDLTELDCTAVHSVNLFISRLMRPQIGFTVYGLFTVDVSAILKVCGTLLTYVIIVLQLKSDETETGVWEGVQIWNETVS